MEKMISSVAKSLPARAAATAQEPRIPAPFWIMALVGGLMFCITVLAGPASSRGQAGQFCRFGRAVIPGSGKYFHLYGN